MEIRLRTDLMPPLEERRRLRNAAGLSGVELATAIGVSPASVYAWEKGTRKPTGLQRRAYRQALLDLARWKGEEDGQGWSNDS